MATTCTSETSADFQWTARRYIPQDTTLCKISWPAKRLSVSTRMELVIKYLLRLNWVIIMALQPFVGPWPLFQFLDPIHSLQDSYGRGSARRKASTYIQNNTNTEWTHTIQTSMPRVGFQPTIPAFERAKTVHASTARPLWWQTELYFI
jgi:hypothetical protein